MCVSITKYYYTSIRFQINTHEKHTHLALFIKGHDNNSCTVVSHNAGLTSELSFAHLVQATATGITKR